MIVVIGDSLAKTLATSAAKLIENETLPQYLTKRRWFGLKDQAIKSARLTNVAKIGDDAHEVLFSEIEVKTTGATTRWLLPLGILWEDEPPERSPVASRWRGCGAAAGQAFLPTPSPFPISPAKLSRLSPSAKKSCLATASSTFGRRKPVAPSSRALPRRTFIGLRPNNPTAR
jgi:hypothetical protein